MSDQRAANPDVHCLNCAARQDWQYANWSLTPEHRKVMFTCTNCGWTVKAEASSWEFFLRQLDERIASG